MALPLSKGELEGVFIQKFNFRQNPIPWVTFSPFRYLLMMPTINPDSAVEKKW
jgi:hypothetical protein